MTDRAAEVSPQVYARVGGWLYLLIFVMAVLSMVLQSGAIAASLTQWRLSVAAELIMFGCDIPLALIFYVLLRPVNANLALLAALWRFAEAVIGSTVVLFHFAPVLMLSGAGNLKALEPQQIQTLVSLSLRLYDYGFGIALIPFGLSCILLGYLIFRSTYFPRTFGVLLQIAGACYVINSFALFVAPGASNVTFIAMLVAGIPAELGLTLWLIIFGVNVPKWNAATLSS